MRYVPSSQCTTMRHNNSQVSWLCSLYLPEYSATCRSHLAGKSFMESKCRHFKTLEILDKNYVCIPMIKYCMLSTLTYILKSNIIGIKYRYQGTRELIGGPREYSISVFRKEKFGSTFNSPVAQTTECTINISHLKVPLNVVQEVPAMIICFVQKERKLH